MCMICTSVRSYVSRRFVATGSNWCGGHAKMAGNEERGKEREKAGDCSNEWMNEMLGYDGSRLF